MHMIDDDSTARFTQKTYQSADNPIRLSQQSKAATRALCSAPTKQQTTLQPCRKLHIICTPLHCLQEFTFAPCDHGFWYPTKLPHAWMCMQAVVHMLATA